MKEKTNKKFPIGAYRHYNSFDEDCNCHLCNEWQDYLYRTDFRRGTYK